MICIVLNVMMKVMLFVVIHVHEYIILNVLVFLHYLKAIGLVPSVKYVFMNFLGFILAHFDFLKITELPCQINELETMLKCALRRMKSHPQVLLNFSFDKKKKTMSLRFS